MSLANEGVDLVPPARAASVRLRLRLGDYLALTKPRVMSLAVFTGSWGLSSRPVGSPLWQLWRP
jgi:hypothetical protein